MRMSKETCNVCGLPHELCVCEDMSKSEGELVVKNDKRDKHDVTVVEGLSETEIDVRELSSMLKNKVAVGGNRPSKSDDSFHIQGHNKNQVADILDEEGFDVRVE